MTFGYIYPLVILVVVWSIFSVLAKIFKLDKRGIIIYPLILVVRSNRFLSFIENEAKKRDRFWKVIADISPAFLWVVLGVSILYFIINLYYLFRGSISIQSGIPVGAQLLPIIPFITVSGKILVYLLVASTIAIIPHEISHGVIAVRSGFKIKSTGFFFLLGAILGAFVELPEEELVNVIEGNRDQEQIKLRDIKKVLAAGIFFNIILFGTFYGLVLNYDLIMSPFFEINGVEIVSVNPNSPAYKAGLVPGTIIVQINDTRIRDVNGFISYMRDVSPGDIVILYSANGEVFIIKTSAYPNDARRAYIGITIMNHYASRIPFIPDETYMELFNFIYLSMLLQFIVIITNALPIFVSDGAKFLLVSLKEWLKNDHFSNYVYLLINWLCLIILIANFILPLVK